METQQGTGFPSRAEAYAELEGHAKDTGLVDLPPGTSRRPPLHDAEDREPSEVFFCLAQPSRRPASRTRRERRAKQRRPATLPLGGHCHEYVSVHA
jgi:hypothetical protein